MEDGDDIYFAGSRVRLRRFRKADFAALMAYRADPEVARYQSWPEMDASGARSFIEAMSSGPPMIPGQWRQIALDDGEGALLGDFGVHLAEDGAEVELGITLSRAAQRRGLGEAACMAALALIFGQSRAKRVIAITDARNDPALRLLRRLPFEETGRLDPTDETPDGEISFMVTRPAA